MVKLRRVYENLCFESQKDLDDLKKHLGDDLYNDYMKIRNKIPKDQNDYKDFQKLKKLPIEDVQDFVDNFQSEVDKRKEAKKGAKKIYDDKDWLVYHITTYPAAQYYGKNTKWCISGNYPGREWQGKKYFNDYINHRRLDDGYYFYINKKNPSEKYCVLQTEDKEIDSIWDAKDTDNGDNGKVFFQKTGVILPKVKEVNIPNIPDKKELIGRDLHNAIIKKDIDLIKKILKKNPDLDLEKDPISDDSYMELAIKEGSEDIVRLLLDFGVDPNLHNGYFIMLAINTLLFNPLESSLDIIKLLLENGANPNVENGFRETPLGLAQMWDNSSLIDLLKKYGAKE